MVDTRFCKTTPKTQIKAVVEEEGFEPSNPYGGRFTVCCH